jgi:hypothetical protein
MFSLKRFGRVGRGGLLLLVALLPCGCLALLTWKILKGLRSRYQRKPKRGYEEWAPGCGPPWNPPHDQCGVFLCHAPRGGFAPFVLSSFATLLPGYINQTSNPSSTGTSCDSDSTLPASSTPTPQSMSTPIPTTTNREESLFWFPDPHSPLILKDYEEESGD